MKSIPHVLLIGLTLTACGPHIDPAYQSSNDTSSTTIAPAAAPMPERWFPEEPGVYTRTLPNGSSETVVVDAPRPVK